LSYASRHIKICTSHFWCEVQCSRMQ